MTIASEQADADFTGNGTTETYSFPRKVTDEDDVRVILRESATGDETVLTLDTHYTVDGIGDGDGIDVILTDGNYDWIDASGFLDTGWKIMIRRYPAATQETEIKDQASLYPPSIEAALDRIVTICQKLQADIARCIKLPETDDPDDYTVTVPTETDRASGAIVFDADGNVTTGTGALPDVTVTSFMETVLDDTTAGNARTTLGFTGSGGVVAFGDIQNMDTSRLLGRTTTASGSVEQITPGATMKFASLALNMRDMDTSRLWGRTATGTGSVQDITVGAGLSLASTALVVDIATQTNAEAQTASKMIDAATLKYHPAAAKAWALITYAAGVPSATVSNNVTSITDVGTGDLTVNFTTAFSTANYCSVVSARRAASDSALFASVKQGTAPTASALAIQTLTVAPAAEDAAQVSVACFGDI